MATTKLSPIPSMASSHQQTPHLTPAANSDQPFTHGKAWTSFERMGVPVNKFINKVGSEAFWPTGLEEESEKAARILRSFCKEGVQTKNVIPTSSQPQAETKPVAPKHELSLKTNFQTNDETAPLVRRESQEIAPPLPPRGPRTSSAALLKIPAEVIQNALGLAIFTTFRAGTWGASLAAGSGVLIARDAHTRQWSSPSAIGVSTLGMGLLTGIDVADCVIVINTFDALEKFKSIRLSLGGEVALTAGPWGAGGVADYALGRHVQSRGRIATKPTYTYIKSRGLYAGLQLDGTVIGVRSDENAKFYGERVSVEDVIEGRARRWTELNEVLGEIDAVKVVSARENWQTLKEEKPQVTRAPVLLEFVDRRGQQKGSDGVWYKVQDEEKAGKIETDAAVTSEKGKDKVTAEKEEKLDHEKMDRYA